MPSWTELVRERLQTVGLPAGRAEEIVQELAGQLEDVYEEARRRGLDEIAAREAALAEVRDWAELARGIERALRREPDPESRFRALRHAGFFKDVAYGARLVVRKPGFAILAGLTLALAIGANTVAFTFVHSMLFHTLPVDEPERLVRVYGRLAEGIQFGALSHADYVEIQKEASFFEGVLLEKIVPLNLGSEGRNERIWGYAVSGNYFTVLGVAPALGRFFHHEGHEPGMHPEAVLSYGFWQGALAGDPGVVGRTLLLNGHPFTVIGVAPESFTGINVGIFPSVWAPLSMSQQLIPGFDVRSPRNRSFFCLARLAEGAGVEEARAGLEVIAARREEESPESNRGFGFSVLPESEGGIHPFMRGGFIGFSGVLSTVVALVLLLACANVAGLLLARGFYRRKEVSLRLALGATRKRLVLQLLTESLLLAILAGGAGLAMAWWALRFFTTLRPPTDVPLYLPLALDAPVLFFTMAVTLATGILFGLAPALQASRLDLVAAMKETSGAFASRGSALRRALVGGQVALSTVLLVGCGLFLRSLSSARSIDVGFEPRGAVIASLDLSLQGYDTERGRLFFRELGERLRAVPGVESVAWVNMIPFELNINQHELAPEGYEPPPGGGFPSIDRNIVSAGYFATMRTPVVDGREFDSNDDAQSPPVVVINEALARKFWPGERAVGKRLGRPTIASYEVVGVVRDGKYLTLGEDPKPFVFFPFLQRENLGMTLLARTATDPGALLESLREEVKAMDPGLPLYNVKLLEEHVRIALAPARAGAAVLGSFGFLALVLASIGLYGVVALSVAQRTAEIGIRRALGARPGDVFTAVLRSGMGLALPGLVLGLAASVVTSHLAGSLLYGIRPLDPVAFAAAAFVLGATALLASALPARRASSVEPLVALRYE